MSVPVVITIGNPDPSVAPATFSDAVAQLRLLITGEVSESIIPYILSSDVPGTDDQDKVWHRIDSTGRPFGTYIFWNGFWVLEPPPLASQIGWFNGDPTVNFDANGTGLSGPGPVANDVFGWQIMNGGHGTANLSDRFIIAARMDNVGITGWDPDTGWRTNVTGEPLVEGGVTDITLDADTTYQAPDPASQPVSPFVAVAREMDGDDHTGCVYGAIGDGSHDEITLHAATTGNEAPEAISVVNPFFSLAMIQWIGYTLPSP